MGEISEALEKHQKEKIIHTKILQVGRRVEAPLDDALSGVPPELIPDTECDVM